MLIEWTNYREGECSRLEDIPRGATVVSIDGELVRGKCEGCGVYVLDTAPHHELADGIITCATCGGPEETRANMTFGVGGAIDADGNFELHEVSLIREPAPPASSDTMKAALLRIAQPYIKRGRCRWCRSRESRRHSERCPTVIATAGLRGIAPSTEVKR